MQVTRQRQAQRLLQETLPWRGVKQVGPANDVGDTLRCIVNHHGQLIGKQTVGASQHEVADLLCQLLLHNALQSVGDVDMGIIHPYAYAAWLATRRQTITAGARIDIARAVDAAVGNLLAGAGAVVDAAHVRQFLECRHVIFVALSLIHDRPIPLQSKGLQRAQYRICGTGNLAWRVEILDPDQPLTALMTCVQIAAECRHQRTKMQGPGR